jgi:hypothetical protein
MGKGRGQGQVMGRSGHDRMVGLLNPAAMEMRPISQWNVAGLMGFIESL